MVNSLEAKTGLDEMIIKNGRVTNKTEKPPRNKSAKLSASSNMIYEFMIDLFHTHIRCAVTEFSIGT